MASIFDIILGPVASVVKEVIDRQVVDKAASQKINDEIEKALALSAIQQSKAQTDINQEEAKSTNWFVAGGRPAFFWLGCLVLFNSYIIAPYTDAIWHFHVSTLDDHMWELITGILGLGGYRMVEKVKGVAR